MIGIGIGKSGAGGIVVKNGSPVLLQSCHLWASVQKPFVWHCWSMQKKKNLPLGPTFLVFFRLAGTRNLLLMKTKASVMLSVACRWIEIELNHVESELDHERLLVTCLLRLWIMFQSEFICLEYYKGMLQWLYYYQMLVAVFNLPKRVLKVQGFFVFSSLVTEWNRKYWWVEQFFEIERRLCFSKG